MKLSVAILSALVFQFATPATLADPILNPEPAALFEDIDGNGYFIPLGNIFTIEIFDVADFLAVTGNTFGFFFSNTDATDPTNLIPIFDSDDLVGDEAVVDFGAGIVVDVDQAIVQAAFAGAPVLLVFT